MEIKPTGAPVSTIIEIGKRARRIQQQSNEEQLLLHAGVNAVTQIDVNQVVNLIDFNTTKLQNYPGNAGLLELRHAINQHYFDNLADVENIIITSGGTNGLFTTLNTLNIYKVLTPKFYWGTYKMLCLVNKLQHDVYQDFKCLLNSAHSLDHTAIIISDPGNPLGDKTNDSILIEVINKLDSLGIPIIFDAPYRYLFVNENDSFYRRLLSLENVIINESFSKSIGLSGYRTGFIHNSNPHFINEISKRILYNTNGVNVAGQQIITKLLSSVEGDKIIKQYKKKTTDHIQKNIDWLYKNNLLASDIYSNSLPLGIYAVINVHWEMLEKNRIFGAPLSYFTTEQSKYDEYTRVCVSVDHERFVHFFAPLVK